MGFGGGICEEIHRVGGGEAAGWGALGGGARGIALVDGVYEKRGGGGPWGALAGADGEAAEGAAICGADGGDVGEIMKDEL